AIINAVVANALPNLTAALRTQITNDIKNGAGPSGGGGGDAIPHGIHDWIERYFSASEQQRYEHKYGSICQLDRENYAKYMERFTRLASFVRAAAGDAQRQARCNTPKLARSGILGSGRVTS
nr:zinc finger, CCHC-type, retrotransposon Gag domain protein [Tanacetum cinerariifolium]